MHTVIEGEIIIYYVDMLCLLFKNKFHKSMHLKHSQHVYIKLGRKHATSRGNMIPEYYPPPP